MTEPHIEDKHVSWFIPSRQPGQFFCGGSLFCLAVCIIGGIFNVFFLYQIGLLCFLVLTPLLLIYCICSPFLRLREKEKRLNELEKQQQQQGLNSNNYNYNPYTNTGYSNGFTTSTPSAPPDNTISQANTTPTTSTMVLQGFAPIPTNNTNANTMTTPIQPQPVPTFYAGEDTDAPPSYDASYSDNNKKA